MRKFAIALLSLFQRIALLIWKLRGKTEDDRAARRVTSGESWSEFCDTLKAAGAALQFPGTPRDPVAQAEGYRYLSRITRAGLMAFVEHSDPRAPVLHRVVNEFTKLGADNPDNFYLTAALNGTYEYKIKRATQHDSLPEPWHADRELRPGARACLLPATSIPARFRWTSMGTSSSS